MKEETNTPAVVNSQVATIQTQRVSALNIMASRLSVDPKNLLSILKNSVFKGATDDELGALAIVANEYSLNPLLKEIYAFPAKGGGIVPMVGVDGWIRIINDHSQMDGVEFEYEDKAGKPYSCTCKIFRKDRKKPTVITEFYDETHRNTEPWNKSPRRMLRHKALMQCGRVAFGFSGIYDEDEAKDISEGVPLEKKVSATPQFTLEAPTEEVVAKDEESVTVAQKVQESMQSVGASVPLEEQQDAPWGDEDKIPMGEAENENPRAALLLELSKRNIKEAVFMKTMRDKFGITKKMIVELTDAEAKEALAEAKLEQML